MVTREFTTVLQCPYEPDAMQDDEVKRRIIESLRWLGFIVYISVELTGSSHIDSDADECACPDHRGYGHGV